MRSLAALRFTLWFLIFLVLAMMLRPWLTGWWIHLQAEPRVVTPRGDLAEDEKTTIKIFESVTPSVVYITTTSRVLDFWTRDITEIPRGTGTGFIWDDQGHVVTNYHVVKGVRRAKVRLWDQRSFQAVLVGASPRHDVAVLRIDVPISAPHPVLIGTSRDLQVGQKVLAIGNPFGLDYSLTTGVISALNRTIRTEDKHEIEHLIQTDAAINPGNSGGPLIDSAGRVIGMNSAIFSPSGAFAGIGFAVPIDMINRVVPDLIAYGYYRRPSLGIRADDALSARLLAELGVQGVLVLKVVPGSAADLAGLRGTEITRNGDLILGDIILAIGDQLVDSVAALVDALENHQIGDQVLLRIYRGGRIQQIPAVLTAALIRK